MKWGLTAVPGRRPQHLTVASRPGLALLSTWPSSGLSWLGLCPDPVIQADHWTTVFCSSLLCSSEPLLSDQTGERPASDDLEGSIGSQHSQCLDISSQNAKVVWNSVEPWLVREGVLGKGMRFLGPSSCPLSPGSPRPIRP